LIKDLNKSISNIQYNYLNLPSKITFTDGSIITYLYGADGTKLRTVHKIGSTTTTTDLCNDVIYENGTAKMLLTEEGYVSLSDSKYHYYLKDHQGNNRVVVDQSGNVEETNHYYPFGGIFASTGNTQPYKYNGKEFDSKKGLNWYDYGARMYDPALGRFTTVDPMAEKYYEVSPYAYCLNNPIYLIDKRGQEPGPGDLFNTKREAAIDWGMYYNGASIIRKKEMGSSIYEVKEGKNLKGYSYTTANEGEHSVSPSIPANKEEIVGVIHSHGNADTKHINNAFSRADIKYIDKIRVNGYLATPRGSLLERNPYSKKITVISNNLPSDPKDPERKNNIIPKDIPAEKGQQKLDELHQKPNLGIPAWQQKEIHWAF
jgi:RHS repeat-associated protein